MPESVVLVTEPACAQNWDWIGRTVGQSLIINRTGAINIVEAWRESARVDVAAGQSQMRAPVRRGAVSARAQINN